MENTYKLEIIQGYGENYNRRFEVVQKYNYYENGKLLQEYYTIFYGTKEMCIEFVIRQNKKHKVSTTVNI